MLIPFVHSGTGSIYWQVETRGKVHTVSLKPRLSVWLVAFFSLRDKVWNGKSGMESLGLRLPHSGKKLMCYLVCLSSMYKVSPSEGSCHQGMFRLHAIYYRRISLGWQPVFSWAFLEWYHPLVSSKKPFCTHLGLITNDDIHSTTQPN